MQWLSDLYAGDKSVVQIAILAACAIAALVLLALVYRYVFAHRLRVPGGRTRQPRLGLVDAFSLDGQRQLVLVRRDNVEHLIMIGGPNDVLVESQINRTLAPPREVAPAAMNGQNHRREPVAAPPPAPTPIPAPAAARPAIAASAAPASKPAAAAPEGQAVPHRQAIGVAGPVANDQPRPRPLPPAGVPAQLAATERAPLPASRAAPTSKPAQEPAPPDTAPEPPPAPAQVAPAQIAPAQIAPAQVVEAAPQPHAAAKPAPVVRPIAPSTPTPTPRPIPVRPSMPPRIEPAVARPHGVRPTAETGTAAGSPGGRGEGNAVGSAVKAEAGKPAPANVESAVGAYSLSAAKVGPDSTAPHKPGGETHPSPKPAAKVVQPPAPQESERVKIEEKPSAPEQEKKAEDPFAGLDSLEAEMARLLGRDKLS